MNAARRCAEQSRAERAAPGLSGPGPLGACVWAPLALVLGALLVASCITDSGSRSDGPVDWLENIRSVNEQVDLEVVEGDLATARALLVSLLEQPVPSELALADRRIIRQDILFRLAEIAILDGRPDAALQRADEGLELSESDDLFTANLLVARGRALQDLGRDEEAALTYYRALLINDALLRDRLGTGAPEPPTEPGVDP